MFGLLIDANERSFSSLLFKFYFPTNHSVHNIQMKQRSSDIKRIFGICFKAVDDNITNDFIHPTTLTDSIYCDVCQSDD